MWMETHEFVVELLSLHIARGTISPDIGGERIGRSEYGVFISRKLALHNGNGVCVESRNVREQTHEVVAERLLLHIARCRSAAVEVGEECVKNGTEHGPS